MLKVSLLSVVLSVSSIMFSLAGASEDSSKIEPISKTYDYVVVGGGLAGLTTAFRLVENKQDVHLFEGRKDRLGGRSYTLRLENGDYIELGGEIIDSDHETILNLAKELKVGITQKPIYQKLAFYLKDQTKPMDINDVYSEIEKLKKKIPSVIDSLNETYKTDFTKLPENILGVINEYFSDSKIKDFFPLLIADELGIDAKEMGPWGIYFIQKLLSEYSSLISLMKWTNPQFRKLLGQINIGDLKELNQYVITGGNDQLINKLASKIGQDNITYDTVLTSVEKSNDGFILEFVSSEEKVFKVNTKNLILSIPFSAIREGKVKLDKNLDLPEETVVAIDHLPYGANTKITFPMKKNLFDLETFYGVNISNGFSCWTPLIKNGKLKYLTIILGGTQAKDNFKDAENMGSSFESQLLREVQSLGGKIQENGGLYYHAWFYDPLAKGSYSSNNYKAISIKDKYYDLYEESKKFKSFRKYAEPVGNLYFVGEHTQNYSGHLESAVKSGEEVAEIILKKDK